MFFLTKKTYIIPKLTVTHKRNIILRWRDWEGGELVLMASLPIYNRKVNSYVTLKTWLDCP